MTTTIVTTYVDWTYDNMEDMTYTSYSMSRDYETFYSDAFTTVTESGESVSIGDGSIRAVTSIERDDVVFIDDYTNAAKKHATADSVSFSDGFSRAVKVSKSDTATFSDKSIRSGIFVINEAIKFDDDSARKVTILKTEKSFTINEVSSDIGVINCPVDTFTFTDESNREFVVSTKESKFYLFDFDERQGDTVLFDFELFNTPRPSVQSDFSDYAVDYKPLHYETLQPLIPGEYYYKNAYVGVKLALPPTNGRFGVIDGTLYVDVEDTVTKGTLEINVTDENGGITEYVFEKKYYTVPQIQVRIVYAQEGCYADLKEISKTGFKVGLKSLLTGEYVNGEIDFLVDGY